MSLPPISRTQRLIVKLASLSLLLAAGACTGEVFRWQDEKGKTHYGDRPAEGAQRLPIATTPTSSSPQAQWRRVASVHDGFGACKSLQAK